MIFATNSDGLHEHIFDLKSNYYTTIAYCAALFSIISITNINYKNFVIIKGPRTREISNVEQPIQ